MKSPVGRNHPCPCGSGRKYKHCCLRAHDDLETRWLQLRGAEGRMIPELWRVALDAWGADGFHEAQRRFYQGFDLPEDPASGREFESLFLTWFALRFAPKAKRGSEGAPAARRWLDDPLYASDPDRRFVAELATRPVSFHHIVAVDPGRSIDLEDLLTGEACRVVEQSASRIAQRGRTLRANHHARQHLDSRRVRRGSDTTNLPPRRATSARCARGERHARLSLDQTLALDDELRHAYLTIADRLFNPRLPQLRNTDGDPLAPTTLHFDLRCTVAEALDALRSLNATAADDEPDDAMRDSHNQLESFTVSWTKPGNKVNPSWDNTILGTVTVTEGAVSATVNSRRRATRLRREIEKRLGARAMFVRSVEESLEALLAEARSREPGEAEPTPPELAELTAAMMDRHWTEWLDTPVPALANHTPREAATTPEGRERLAALLDEFEWHSGDAQAPPVARLRAELGLEAP